MSMLNRKAHAGITRFAHVETLVPKSSTKPATRPVTTSQRGRILVRTPMVVAERMKTAAMRIP
jgi:hypothetical protein